MIQPSSPPPVAAPIHPFCLTFDEQARESAYRLQNRDWLRGQARVAIVVGLLIYLVYGIVDWTLVSNELLALVWRMRATAMAVAGLVLLYTWTTWYLRWQQLPLVLSGVAAACGIMAIQCVVGLEASQHYLPGMVLVIFWTYLFLGIRFITGLAACLLITAVYNLALVQVHGASAVQLFDHNFHLLAANVIAAVSSYMLERQRRTMFFQSQELDRERREHERYAMEDRLTGIPNRRFLDRALEQVISETGRLGRSSAGLFVDLNHFKPVNDRYGHEAGDYVLKVLAERIRRCVRGSDIVARIGGDEFFVVLRHIDHRHATENTLRHILEDVSSPIPLPDHLRPSRAEAVRVSASIGAVLFPFDQCAPEEIMRRADVAMYACKGGELGSYAFYEDVAEPGERSGALSDVR